MKLRTELGKLPRTAGAMLLLACALAWCGEASASLLPPNDTLFPAPAAADIGGTPVVSETESIIYGSGNVIFGTLASAVTVNDPSNPFYNPASPGELTFTFLLTSAASATPINELSVNGFLNAYSVDASYVAGTGTTAPTFIGRGNSGIVNFSFDTPNIAAGTSSMELVLHTNATQWANANPIAAIIGNSGIASSPTYMPVPEPTSLALALAGLATVVGFGWRRRRAR